MKKLIQIFCILFLLAACQVESPQPVPQDESVNPNLSTKREGPHGKATVLRTATENTYGFHVPEKNITLILGSNARDLLCSGIVDFDEFSLTRVLKPDGDAIPRIHDLAKGEDILLEIWPFSDPNFNCQPFQDNDPIYSGRVKVVLVDNDLIPFDDSKNINSFGFRAVGEDISVIYRGAWDGQNDETWVTRVCKIKYQ